MEGTKSDIQTVHNENSFKLCKLEITFLSYTVTIVTIKNCKTRHTEFSSAFTITLEHYCIKVLFSSLISQTLINLMLTGYSVSNVWDSSRTLSGLGR